MKKLNKKETINGRLNFFSNHLRKMKWDDKYIYFLGFAVIKPIFINPKVTER